MALITFEDKENVRTSNVAAKNKIGADDINEIKRVVNENEQLKKIRVTLNKTQINNFGTTNVIVPASELDLPNNTIVYISHVITYKDRDGVDFSISGFRGISVNPNITALGTVQINESSDKDYFVSTSNGGYSSIQELPISNDLEIGTTLNAITGGGANCSIILDIYYKPIYI
jgi:hypothetical protein